MPSHKENNGNHSYLILIDALRYDYINKNDAPFLYSLKSNSLHAEVVETFAFQTRPAYFAGLEPEESNICHLFRFDPQGSPFAFLKPFGALLDFAESLGLDRFLRGIIRRNAASKERNRGHDAASDVMSTEQIPLSLLHHFALSELVHTDSTEPYPGELTLFDELRAKGLTWNWIGYPRYYGSTETILAEYQKAPPADLNYLHFSELDWVGHRFGPDSLERKETLRKLDNTIEELLKEKLEAGNTRAVIFGDHGMVHVKYTIDLMAKLTQLPYKNGREYLVFLDSTQARFWFFDKRCEDEIRSMLMSLEGGHILSESEREKLKIRFRDRSYGDLIFMLDGPGIIHPSYFSKDGDGPKGMHGYLPSVKENMTQIIACGVGIECQHLGTIPMREMYDLIKRALL